MKSITHGIPAVMMALVLWGCSTSKPAPSPAASGGSMMAKESGSSFYAEESYKSRLYVFGTEKAHKSFKDHEQVPTIAKTFIGAGPEGQTVVLEADAKTNDLQERLKVQYESRHGSKLN
jgi:hypothetical protein